MQTNGSNASSAISKDIQFIVDDYETALEQRDLNTMAKNAIPNFKHSDFSFIGSKSCNKQKTISKLFAQNLLCLVNGTKDTEMSSPPTDE
jgi:hypothetical protein